MEFYEAIQNLYDYRPEGANPDRRGYCKDWVCKECGHKLRQQWAMWRHIDHKHSDKLLAMSGQAHGWDNARNGWPETG